MNGSAKPALEKLLAQFAPPFAFGQVEIRLVQTGYSLRHVADDAVSDSKLLRLAREELRHWVERTEGNSFRPLKAGPTLERGWIYFCAGKDALEDALQIVYPGSVADWYAAQQPIPPVTHFREFAARQTGRYKSVSGLNDTEAVAVAEATCHPQFCIKQRLWTVADLPPDADGKSVLPCLEPCAMLLEMARRAATPSAPAEIPLTSQEVSSILAALNIAMQPALNAVPEGELAAAGNPRRLKLLANKIATKVNADASNE